MDAAQRSISKGDLLDAIDSLRSIISSEQVTEFDEGYIASLAQKGEAARSPLLVFIAILLYAR
jgi:hypothetical protein